MWYMRAGVATSVWRVTSAIVAAVATVAASPVVKPIVRPAVSCSLSAEIEAVCAALGCKSTGMDMVGMRIELLCAGRRRMQQNCTRAAVWFPPPTSNPLLFVPCVPAEA
jgi:hypothetical protein